MDYCLKLHSLPKDFEELNQKFRSIKNVIEASNLWKKGKEPLPDLEQKSSKPKWHISLNRCLVSGCKGYLNFQNRHSFGDEAMHDDRMILEFSSKKIDFEYLRDHFFVNALTSFSCYRSYFDDEELSLKDFDRFGVPDIRRFVDRINLIDFISDAFCQIYFRKNSKDVAALLKKNGFEVKHIKDGIIIMLANTPIPTDELENRSDFALAVLSR